MEFYDIVMSPLETFLLKEIRNKVIPNANGNVLEIGIGTGANLKYYDYTKVSKLTGLDVKLTNSIKQKASDKFVLVENCAQTLPFADNSFDTVVATLVFCSVDDQNKGFNEIKRVLKDNGKFIFVEHIQSDSKKIAKIFDKCNNVWTKIANGCNLNRDTISAIKESGLDILWVEKSNKGIFCYGIANKI